MTFYIFISSNTQEVLEAIRILRKNKGYTLIDTLNLNKVDPNRNLEENFILYVANWRKYIMDYRSNKLNLKRHVMIILLNPSTTIRTDMIENCWMCCKPKLETIETFVTSLMDVTS